MINSKDYFLLMAVGLAELKNVSDIIQNKKITLPKAHDTMAM